MAQETIKRIGFGQVEPNHLSMQRTGQIHAQLPAAEARMVSLPNTISQMVKLISQVLENGIWYLTK